MAKPLAFTPNGLDALRAGSINDSQTAGLSVHATARGWRVFKFRRRVGGTWHKETLGRFPAMTIADARAKAAALNLTIDSGIAPVEAKRELERQRAAVEADTVAAVFERYMEANRIAGVAQKSANGTRSLFKKHIIPALGAKPVRDVAKRDVIDLRRSIQAAGTRGAADRVRTALSAFLAWCSREDIVEFNVARELRNEHRSRRHRYLTMREVGLYWRATEALIHDRKRTGEASRARAVAARDCLRLMILTGSRRAEASGAKSVEFTEKGGFKMWHIPRERAKTDATEYVLPLPPLAWSLVENRLDREWTFLDKPTKHSLNYELKLIRAEMARLSGHEIPPFAPCHSLRHAIRTATGELELTTPDVAERILNHAVGGINNLYDHGTYLKPKLAALEKWEQAVMDEVDRQTGENVISLTA